MFLYQLAADSPAIASKASAAAAIAVAAAAMAQSAVFLVRNQCAVTAISGTAQSLLLLW
jgi:hypothetical protein